MSVQRRRGLVALVYRQKLQVDRRGSEQYVVDLSNPYRVRVSSVPVRGSKAEVPGQQQIVVYTMTFTPDPRDVETTQLKDIGLWSRVLWNGDLWDVVAPPIYHHGTRHTRHWSMDVRERPEAVPA